MQKLRLENLKEGMITAAEVKNLDDMLLLPAGCQLTSRHIKILRSWGVPEVVVESAGEEADPDRAALANIDPVFAEKIQDRIRSRFREWNADHPFHQELLRLLVVRECQSQHPK